MVAVRWSLTSGFVDRLTGLSRPLAQISSNPEVDTPTVAVNAARMSGE